MTTDMHEALASAVGGVVEKLAGDETPGELLEGPGTGLTLCFQTGSFRWPRLLAVEIVNAGEDRTPLAHFRNAGAIELWRLVTGTDGRLRADIFNLQASGVAECEASAVLYPEICTRTFLAKAVNAAGPWAPADALSDLYLRTVLALPVFQEQRAAPDAGEDRERDWHCVTACQPMD